MTKQEAIMILRNTAWLGTNEDRDKAEQALEVIAEALEGEQICCINCIHCKVMGEVTRYSYCDMWDSVVDPYGYCNYGERKE